MPDTTMAEMRKLRAWRTWLLVTVAAVQGGQWVLRPELALKSSSFTSLRPLGLRGWTVFGALLVVLAAYLAAVPTRLRWTGHVAGAMTYLSLMFASLFSGVVPALLVLAAGLHLGEVRLWAWHRRRDR